jgi:hypothetical protein
VRRPPPRRGIGISDFSPLPEILTGAKPQRRAVKRPPLDLKRQKS